LRVMARAELPVDPNSVVGDKLGRWLKTPFDLLAFGPRASTGALLSAPEKLSTLPNDIQRVVELIQDPRPVEEKQTVLFKELEETVCEFLEKGAGVETDILANVKTILPAEAANMLTELIPQPPVKEEVIIPVQPVDVPVTVYQPEDVFQSQIASEVTEIKNAVTSLKAVLDDVRANTDPSRTNILRLNLREARDQLQRRLNEVAGSSAMDASVSAAVREAGILLDEVNAQFF